MNLVRFAGIWLLFGLLVPALFAQKPAVIYADGNAIVFLAADGKVVQRIATNAEAESIAFSPVSGRLVIQTKGEWGGGLFLVDRATGKLQKLLTRPLYFKPLPKKERDPENEKENEVYADPEFDRSGNLLVFAVHDSGPGAWDAVLASGPLAVLDLRTLKAHILESTLLKDQEGPAYSNDPHWSPDQSHILWDHEAGSELADAEGKASKDISNWFDLKESEQGYAECWLDDHSILYAVYPGSALPVRFSVLDLATRKSRSAAEVLGLGPENLDGAREVNVTDSMILVRKDVALFFDRKTRRPLFTLPDRKQPIELLRP
jgi:hypothetical protein